MDKIKVLLVDSSEDNRENIKRILFLEERIYIIGEAASGEEALKKTEQLLPDVVILEMMLPVMNGISVAEKISLNYPGIIVIIVSTIADNQYYRKAMLAGVRDYLIKPFNADDLLASIVRNYQAEKQRQATFSTLSKEDKKNKYKTPMIVSFFGCKGGIGKTTLSVNTAVKIAEITHKKVVVIDLDLQFGDVAMFFNISPKRGIAELVQERGELDINLIEKYLFSHSSGVQILPAPMRPEDAEIIKSEQILSILTVLRQNYDYILIDTHPAFQDITLSAMDMSNQIIMLLSMDLPAIKNTRLGLEVLESLHHIAKTKLVLNRASDRFGISPADAERVLDFPISCQLSSDGKVAVSSANMGVPLVIQHPHAKLSKEIELLSEMIISDSKTIISVDTGDKKGLSFLKKIFKK